MVGNTIQHHEMQTQLGKGGMGVVYKARDTRLNRHVAIKVLPSNTGEPAERKTRFIKEARAASALNHPNIVTVHDILTDDDGNDCIVMEYIDGRTLNTVIGRKGLESGTVLRYGIQIADATVQGSRCWDRPSRHQNPATLWSIATTASSCSTSA